MASFIVPDIPKAKWFLESVTPALVQRRGTKSFFIAIRGMQEVLLIDQLEGLWQWNSYTYFMENYDPVATVDMVEVEFMANR